MTQVFITAKFSSLLALNANTTVVKLWLLLTTSSGED